MTIHLLCNRCRAEGFTGEDPFAAYADLLDFTPVPRRKKRADGWDGEVQRAFIAALAATGSARQAAAAVGKAQFGVENLKNADGNESFMAAYERALAFHAENRSLRLADSVRAASALAAHRFAAAPKPAWSNAATRHDALASSSSAHFERAGGDRRSTRETDPAYEPDHEWTPEHEQETQEQVHEAILRKYWLKLGCERDAREEGRIAAADFYLRQLTNIEIALDLASREFGSADAMQLFLDLRLSGFDKHQIAETPISKALDDARRAHWIRCGDPPRPAPVSRDLLREHEGGIVTQPLLVTHGGLPESHEEQRARYESTYAREAVIHIKWEAEARADYAERKARDAERRSDLREEPEEAGQPAPLSGDRTDVTEFTSVTAPDPEPNPDPDQ